MRTLCTAMVAAGALLVSGAAFADTVTFGTIAHLTGYGAQGFGRPTNWGSQVGVAEINASNVMGGTEIKQMSEDDASDPTVAITAFNKLLQQHITIITESAISKICSAVAPVAQQANTSFICIGGTGVGTPDTKAPYTALNEPGGPMSSLARYIITKKGAKRIASIFDTDNAGSFDSMSAGFVSGMKSEGINDYVTVQKISQKDTDFASVLTNLQQAKPDAVQFYCIAAQCGNIILQMAQMGGFENVVKAGHVGWTAQVPQVAGPAATGALLVQAWIPTPDSKTFIDEYTKTSGGQAPTAYSALGHDAMWLLASAVKLAKAAGKTPDGANVQSMLTQAALSPDFKAHALIHGLTFSDMGRTMIPGIVATYDAKGNMVKAP